MRDRVYSSKSSVKRVAFCISKECAGREVSEDDERRAQDEVQRLTDRTIAEVDRLVQGKEAEVMAV